MALDHSRALRTLPEGVMIANGKQDAPNYFIKTGEDAWLPVDERRNPIGTGHRPGYTYCSDSIRLPAWQVTALPVVRDRDVARAAAESAEDREAAAVDLARLQRGADFDDQMLSMSDMALLNTLVRAASQQYPRYVDIRTECVRRMQPGGQVRRSGLPPGEIQLREARQPAGLHPVDADTQAQEAAKDSGRLFAALANDDLENAYPGSKLAWSEWDGAVRGRVTFADGSSLPFALTLTG